MAPLPGPRFPFIDLEKAMFRAIELYNADRSGRHMPIKTALEVWGYSEKSSGGYQTVAALKMYDLIDDAGTGEARTIGLTEAGRSYHMDEREDERVKLLKHFALSPKLFRRLWEDWGATPPADNVARSHLKLVLKLNEQSARSVLGIYKNNLDYASLTGQDEASAPAQEAPITAPQNTGSVAAQLQPASVQVKGYAPTVIAERVVFVEAGGPDQYLKLVATGDGEFDDFLLEALENFVSRQRRRLQAKGETKKDEPIQ